MSDKYRIVTTVFRTATASAIKVDLPHKNETTWIPRSLLHGGDDLKIERLGKGDEFTFRLREWKAEGLGFS